MGPRIRIFLDTHLDDFPESERATFIERLEELTGSPFGEFADVSFAKGCVIFSGTPPPESVKRLYEAYQQRNRDIDDPAHRALCEFFEQCKVNGIEFDDYDHKRELKERQARTPDGCLIAFVHGYTGDKTTFGQLPTFLGEAFRCRTAIYEYPTSWYKKNPTLYAISNIFGNWLRRQGDVQDAAIICHSMGGVIARMCLSTEIFRDMRYDERVALLSLIASPNSGTEMASVLNFFKTGQDPQVKALATNEDFITELNRNRAGWLAKVKPKRLQVRTVYGSEDKVVSSASAAGWDNDPVNILGADHRDIVKPNSAKDEIVEVLKYQLQEAGFEAA